MTTASSAAGVTLVPSYKECGEGPAVVFLHGLGGNRHSFDYQCQKLQDQYRCIAWDVPGYGDSAPLSHMSFESLSQTFDNLLDAVQSDAYAIVGHSLGGMIAQAWLARGGQCDKLVLAQTSASFGKPGSDWNTKFLASRLQPIEQGKTPADFAGALITDMFHATDKDEAIAAGVATMAPLPATVYRQAIECLVTFDAADALRSLQPHTLCLAGEYDTTAPAKTMQRMAAEIPNAQFVCLADTGHLAYLEVADQFTAAILEFLNT